MNTLQKLNNASLITCGLSEPKRCQTSTISASIGRPIGKKDVVKFKTNQRGTALVSQAVALSREDMTQDPGNPLCWTIPTQPFASAEHIPSLQVEALVNAIDGVIDQHQSSEAKRAAVDMVLEDFTTYNRLELPEYIKRASKDNECTKFELHTDPDGKYSVVAMVWNAHSGTPIHTYNQDESMWVSETVADGEVKVNSYRRQEAGSLGKLFEGFMDHHEDEVSVVQTGSTLVGRAARDATTRIPTLRSGEYQMIANNREMGASVTLHVFGGGSMATEQHIDCFMPIDTAKNVTVIRGNKAQQFRKTSIGHVGLKDAPLPPVWSGKLE